MRQIQRNIKTEALASNRKDICREKLKEAAMRERVALMEQANPYV